MYVILIIFIIHQSLTIKFSHLLISTDILMFEDFQWHYFHFIFNFNCLSFLFLLNVTFGPGAWHWIQPSSSWQGPAGWQGWWSWLLGKSCCNYALSLVVWTKLVYELTIMEKAKNTKFQGQNQLRIKLTQPKLKLKLCLAELGNIFVLVLHFIFT